MAGSGTRGDGRTKPEWGKGADPAPPSGRAGRASRGRATGGAKGGGPAVTKGGGNAPAGAGPTAAAKARPKVARKASAKGSRGAGRTRATQRSRRLRKRYGIVYDTSGPRVRLGIAWFVAAFVAIVVSPMATGLVYGLAAAVTGAQMARAWRKGGGPRPSDLMAAAGAGLIGAGACFGAGGAGLGMLAAVGLAYVAAAGDTRTTNPRLVDVGWTLQSALAPGVVAMSMVLLARLDQGSAIALLLMVSVYETGDYLVGSGAQNPYEGPAAGVAAIVVVTFIVSTLPISSLSFGQAWLFGGLVAVLAPAGQLLASGLLPSATAAASGLRRLDSLLLTAPVWAWGVGLLL